ncbi:hypothetical protein GPAL_0543 [Glaciecola pallidula DSM 14239 = ACAM 615]|uniref:Uncharacterized protein n=1 Tax=Brumicola pallidula DSM 14239 = ACAM 615 TaxID=1121922 RepID=K6ZER8_9ALTE|nr:hypothetical protein GPAL_0543 [Glaciecola pallidula DSM 14239 = ACAM 615]
MKGSLRLFYCSRCYSNTVICSSCDRGNIYCHSACSYFARKITLQRASRKYQATRIGRLNNATRQQRFRTRQKQKVTHQGSNTLPCYAVVPIKHDKEVKDANNIADLTTCHFCLRNTANCLRIFYLYTGNLKHPAKPK